MSTRPVIGSTQRFRTALRKNSAAQMNAITAITSLAPSRALSSVKCRPVNTVPGSIR